MDGSDLAAHSHREERRKTTIAPPKMRCGSFYIPKPSPTKPLGEDAHFVCEAEQVIGVADGVGDWSKRGIDAGDYARRLMSNSAASVRLKTRSGAEIDPISVLRIAYAATTARGSSTACIAALDGHALRAANVGDSGFLVFRESRCAFASPTQQSRFNCPYQLGVSRGCQRPSAACEMVVGVAAGDVVVLGTDGLLDNVYPWEIEDLLRSMEKEELELDADQMAELIAEIALESSRNRYFRSPFQANAEEAGRGGFAGGKVDDITVIIALIC